MHDMSTPDIGMKVKEGYEHNNYNDVYRPNNRITVFEKKCLDLFLSQLVENATILDLGCGAANTYDCYMVKQGYKVVGIDFSQKQIRQAQKNCPKATFICKDILDFPISDVYGGITFFYSLFHINREQHEQLFKKIYDNTSSNCVILLNIRKEDSGGIKVKSDFCDCPMYWSHYSSDVFINIMKKIGYVATIIGDEKDYGSSESHLWLFLRK